MSGLSWKKYISRNRVKEENKLNIFINNCINIENNINEINSINENIAKCQNLNKKEMKFPPNEENEIQNFLKTIKTFGEIILPKISESINY